MQLQKRYLYIIFIFFFATGCHAEESIFLTWQHNPSSTMTIQWMSSSQETTCKVAYRPSQGEESWKVAQGTCYPLPKAPQYLLHRVELTQLNADQQYTFKVLPADKQYKFRTVPLKLEKELKFVVGGDMYHDDISFMKKTSQVAAKTDPYFAVIGGDIAYAVNSHKSKTQKMERWMEWIKAWHATMVTSQGNLIPVVAAIGNHDLIGHFDQTPKQAEIFSLLFPSSNQKIYSALDFGNYLSLFLLDSGHANPIGGAQTTWLNTNLQARQNIPHLFAIYHVPAYPCVRSFFNKQSTQIRRNWIPLFEKWGLQAAFEHHDHIYKRSHPLLKRRLNPQGILYLGDGGWGVEKLRHAAKKRYYIAKCAPKRHFIAVSLTPSMQIFKAIDDQGNVFDETKKPVFDKNPLIVNPDSCI